MKKKNIFLLIGLFWLIIIIGFVAYQEFTLKTGQEVLLKTQPVDPRDLFRGDYVVLRYDISQVDLTELDSDISLSIGEQVYAQLTINEDGYGELTGLTKTSPADGLFIRGNIKRKRSETRYDISYGIESYFVPEGKGRQLERQMGEVDVKASVDKYGRAIIKDILVDGKKFEFEDEED